MSQLATQSPVAVPGAQPVAPIVPQPVPITTPATPVQDDVLDPQYLDDHEKQLQALIADLPDRANRVQNLIAEMRQEREALKQEREASERERVAMRREKEARDAAHGEHHQKMMSGLAQLSRLLEEALANSNS